MCCRMTFFISCVLPDMTMWSVETVCLLSKYNTEQHIEVEFNLDKLDLTAAEIKVYVLEHTGLKVSSLYIAQVKRKCGLEVGQNYNLTCRRRKMLKRQSACRKRKRPPIVQ